MSKGKNKVPFLIMAAGVVYAIWPFDIPGPIDEALVLFATTLLSTLIKIFTNRLGAQICDSACDEFAKKAVNTVLTAKASENTITIQDKEEPDNKRAVKASSFH